MIHKLNKTITVVICTLSVLVSLQAGAQLPQCDRIYLERMPLLGLLPATNEIFTYDPAVPVGPGNPALNTIAYPSNMLHGGLTVSSVLGSTNTTRTFYTMMGATAATLTLWYYDPTALTWVNTGNDMGNAGAVNLAAGGPYIYGLVGATGQIYQYDGSGNGSLLVTVSDFVGEGPYDLIGDCDGNVYIFNGTGESNPAFLRKYSPSGALLQSWTVTVPAGYTPSGGFAIVGNSFFTDHLDLATTLSSHIASGSFVGATVDITTISPALPAPFGLFDVVPDLGSCDEAIPRLAELIIAATDTVICGAREVTFWADSIANQGDNPAYQWFVNGVQVPGATDTFYQYTPQNGDVVTCRLVSDRRCVAEITVMSNAITMVVDNAIQPELSYFPDEFCTDRDSPVLPILNSPGGTFTAGGGLSIDNITGAITPGQCLPGEYTITYTNPPPVACPQYSTVAIVNVYPPAKAVIEVGDFPDPVCLTDTIVLHAVETKGNFYTWEPTDRITGPGDMANAVVKRNQAGLVHLTVYAKGGCVARDSVFVDKGRSCCTVLFPNAFSPNADGLNDAWKIQTKEIQAVNALQVFNRYGQLVFESRNIDESWDGTHDGKPCDAGVYHYLFTYTCDNGVLNQKKGNITLIK